ncbi:MAG: hypothetical protein JO250_01400 [Armatimonadetes bacterium]|nr:hypothetical protein [Armatimonadota bacterium]
MLGIPLALVTGGLFLVVATALVSRGSFETRHRKEATPAWQEQLNAGLVRTDHVIPYDSNAASEDDLAGTWVLEAQTGRGDDISETLNDARTGKWLGGSLSVVPAASGTYRLRTSRGVVFYIAEDDRITRVGPGHYAETHADPDNSDKYYTDLRVVGRKLTALRHEICQVHRYRPLMDPLRYEMWVTYVFHRK